jgi:hypothetical protein
MKYVTLAPSTVIVILALGVTCAGQAIPKSKTAPSDSEIAVFLKTIEDRPRFVERWDEVRSDAAAQAIKDDISPESWRRLLRAAANAGLKSRSTVQLHPRCREKAYFDDMVHEFGYDSDFFTRGRVLGFMVERYPDDPRTARFGLLLLLEGWNASWPNGINLHGNSPRDAIELVVMKQWIGISYGDLTPEKCGQLLAQSEKWAFDKGAKKWRVSH